MNDIENYIKNLENQIEFLERKYISEDDYIKAYEIYGELAEQETDSLRIQAMAMETYLTVLKSRLKSAERKREAILKNTNNMCIPREPII